MDSREEATMDTSSAADRPAAPWQVRDDWASGRIEAADTRRLFVNWFVAFVLNAICIPAGFLVYDQVFTKGNIVLAPLFVVPLISLGQLLRTLWLTVRGRPHPPAILQLESTPGVVGGRLRGTIHVPVQLSSAVEVRLRLTCTQSDVHRDIGGDGGADRDGGTSTICLHEDVWRLSPSQLQPADNGALVPVEAGIPYTARETETSQREHTIDWVLELVAVLLRREYRAAFDVPVFRTAESDPAFVPAPRAEAGAAELFRSTPTYAGITVGPDSSGGTRIFFGPARMKGCAAIASLVALAATGGTYALFWNQVHLAFQVLAGLIAAFLLYVAAHAWLNMSVLRVAKGTLYIRQGLLGIGIPRKIPCRSVWQVRAASTGERSRGPEQVYYFIEVKQEDGKPRRVGDYVPDRGHAEWLAKTLGEAIERGK
jgi:hypothetical protein